MSRHKHALDPYAVEVIKAIGGNKAVADLCAISSPSVSEWKRKDRGIPPAREQYLRVIRPAAFRAADRKFRPH
jgi:DNA-binding transcriptional regulator YdaS (Cro superfamily)